LIAVLIMAGVFSHIFAQEPDTSALIDKYLSIRTEMGGYSGAILVAKAGKIIIRKGYGYADVERRVPYTPNTKHEVASISKMFTAMAALKLRDSGRLRLEDSICTYLKECPDVWRPVTIQELMRHTSGIPDYQEPLVLGSDKYLEFMTKPDASTQIYENAKKQPLDFPSGSKFNYSNTGYIVLSRVIERASGEAFEKFVVDKILRPAKMLDSGVINSDRLPPGLASGYSFGDRGWTKIVGGVSLTDGHLRKQPELSLRSPHGDAWLYSTVDDLYKWSVVMDGGKVVPVAEAKEVFTAGLDNYGYGWFVGSGFGRRRMRHNGALPGYISDFVKFPDDHITIVIFSNLDRARLSQITRDISSIVLGAPYDMPVRGTVVKLTDQEVARLTGDFKMTDGKLLTIRNEPDYLTAKLQDRFTAGLIPLSPTEFYFPLGDGKVIFALDENGRAKSVNIRYSGEDHVAERIQ